MKNKTTIWVIITLLLLSSFMAGYGYYVHVDKIKNPPPENPNKEFKVGNRLYFYNESKELIGTYDCTNNYCGYAKNSIDDSSFYLNYYKNATSSEMPLIHNRYAFLVDNTTQYTNDLFLYDVVNKREVQKLTGVKNYTIGISNDYYIVRDTNSKWGIMKMSNNAGMVVDFKYNFIGLPNSIDFDTGLLKTDGFIVYDVNGWKVISESDSELSSYTMNQVYDYMNGYTITTNSTTYYLNNSNGDPVLSNGYKLMQFVEGYLKVLDDEGNCYLMDVDSLSPVSSKYLVDDMSNLEVIATLNGLELYMNGELQETVPSK